MVDLLVGLEALASISFVVGAVVAVIELRRISRDRKAETILRLAGVLDSLESEQAYEKILGVDMTHSPEPELLEQKVSRAQLIFVSTQYDYVGYLLKKNLIDRDLVLEVVSPGPAWRALRKWIAQYREHFGSDAFENFEAFARIAAEHNAKVFGDNPDELMGLTGSGASRKSK